MLGFLKPKWKSKDPEVRLAALEKIKDQKIIRTLARTDPDLDVRIAAIEHLEDEFVLGEMAQNDREAQVRLTATECLEDDNILARLVHEAEDLAVRRTAAERIEDQDLLVDIARNVTEPTVCRVALARLDSQEVLADIAKNAYDETVCCIAIEFISDEAILADIVDNVYNEKIRHQAEQAVENLKIITPHIRRLADKTQKGRLAAVEALTASGDARAVGPLVEVLTDTDEEISLRQAAARGLGRIKSSAAVEPLANVLKAPDENEELRSMAAQSLGMVGDVQALPVFDQILRFTDGFLSPVRRSTVQALSQFNDPAAVPPLILALMDEDTVIHTRALNALKRIGRPAIGPLVEALQDEELEGFGIRHLVEALEGITGKGFGDDMERWVSWWEEDQRQA